MKNLTKVMIRLLVIYSLFSFINSIPTSVGSIITSIQFNQVRNVFQLIGAISPFILLFSFHLILIFLLWKKSSAISILITQDLTDEKENNLSLDNGLDIGLSILGIYIIIVTIPSFFKLASTYLLTIAYYGNQRIENDYLSKEFINLISVVIKFSLGFFLIRNGSELIKKIKQSNKNKS